MLDVVDVELGSRKVDDEVLWTGGRWKVYLYVAGRKVVGCLLAERIRRGWRVVGDGAVGRGEGVEGVVLGVARVWVGKGMRRKGVARRLVETARESFVYGMRVGMGKVAFSQPTDSGRRFARGLVGGEGDGWLVYEDGDGMDEGDDVEGGSKAGDVCPRPFERSTEETKESPPQEQELSSEVGKPLPEADPERSLIQAETEKPEKVEEDEDPNQAGNTPEAVIIPENKRS